MKAMEFSTAIAEPILRTPPATPQSVELGEDLERLERQSQPSPQPDQTDELARLRELARFD